MSMRCSLAQTEAFIVRYPRPALSAHDKIKDIKRQESVENRPRSFALQLKILVPHAALAVYSRIEHVSPCEIPYQDSGSNQ